MALLDTTALVDLSRPPASAYHQNVAALVSRLIQAGETIFTSRINEAEFRVGAHRAKHPPGEGGRIEAVLSATVVLDLDAAAAKVFARIRANLLDRGRSVAALDLLIASIALANGQSLITRNARDFDPVPGLMVIGY